MDEKDKIIASLRPQLQAATIRISALEQENALLSHQQAKTDEDPPFCIPDYGTDEWADWMIEINKRRGEESPL